MFLQPTLEIRVDPGSFFNISPRHKSTNIPWNAGVQVALEVQLDILV